MAERGAMPEPGRPDRSSDYRETDGDFSDSLGLLDEEPIPTPHLSFLEKKNLVFLGALYFIHAIPLQFSWLTMPILLRQQLSYSNVGTFLISQYPYSWKAAWSPLVDGLYHPIIGRRKTWIVPSLVVGGATLFWLSFAQDSLVADVASGKALAMAWIVLAWLMVMVVCANIRIALDSWAINLLSSPNVHWASPIASVGETAATVLSCNLFLGVASLNSTVNEAGKAEQASTRFFFGASASTFVITAFLLLVGKRERDEGQKTHSIRNAYTLIWRILKLRHVWILMLVHIASMIGFITNDTITVLQLVKNNFSDLELAALATAALPFAIVSGFVVARAFETRHPLHVWRKMYPWRLALAFVSQITVLFMSLYPDSPFRWFVIVLPFCLSRFFEAGMWAAFVAFHAQISDPLYGGIYMSLLSTTLNIRYDTLQFIFTNAIGMVDGSGDLAQPSPPIDGYQIVNGSAVILAIPIYWFFLKPATLYVQTLDVSAWRIKDKGVADPVAYEMVATIEEDA